LVKCISYQEGKILPSPTNISNFDDSGTTESSPETGLVKSMWWHR